VWIEPDGQRAVPRRVTRPWREDLMTADLAAEGSGYRLEVHGETSEPIAVVDGFPPQGAADA